MYIGDLVLDLEVLDSEEAFELSFAGSRKSVDQVDGMKTSVSCPKTSQRCTSRGLSTDDWRIDYIDISNNDAEKLYERRFSISEHGSGLRIEQKWDTINSKFNLKLFSTHQELLCDKTFDYRVPSQIDDLVRIANTTNFSNSLSLEESFNFYPDQLAI